MFYAPAPRLSSTSSRVALQAVMTAPVYAPPPSLLVSRETAVKSKEIEALAMGVSFWGLGGRGGR